MVRRITVNYHDILDEWAQARGVSFNEYPAVGWMTDNLAIFIVETNYYFCFVEPMISKPGTPKDELIADLKLLSEEFVSYAKRAGFTLIYGMTKIDNVAMYGTLEGFENSQNKFLLMRRI